MRRPPRPRTPPPQDPVITDLRKKLDADCEYVSKHPDSLPLIVALYHSQLSAAQGGDWMLAELRLAAVLQDEASRSQRDTVMHCVDSVFVSAESPGARLAERFGG